ncbi:MULTISPECIES: serine/threonine-protein kinase [unclassified Nocardioides]|uniref:serine/threonine-protein kinase n=1 Tax=unclassified Nocardioides TaxID=2615069 RepID=UPI0030152A30
MSIGPGTLLRDRYVLGEVLGRGGSADVYAAEDRLLHRPVAVKVLRDSPDTEADRARFAAEARVLARLSHPGLVLLLDAGTQGEHPYLVLELVVGRTWAQELAGRAVDAREAARVGVQVAAALAAAHAAGVIHRDVKPGNVLVDASGRARLADFGIARLVDESLRHTRTGFTVGTAAYLAPEQVRGDEVSGATDVYALGLVLLEAVTGERAYPGTSVEAAFARLRRNPTIPVSLPRGWPRLLAGMTATDPVERPTAVEVADRLAALADPDAETVVPDEATAAVALSGRRRATWVPAAGIAAALALLIAVAGVVGRSDGPEQAAAAKPTPSAAATPTVPDPSPTVAAAAVVVPDAEPARAATTKAAAKKTAAKKTAAKKTAAKKTVKPRPGKAVKKAKKAKRKAGQGKGKSQGKRRP